MKFKGDASTVCRLALALLGLPFVASAATLDESATSREVAALRAKARELRASGSHADAARASLRANQLTESLDSNDLSAVDSKYRALRAALEREIVDDDESLAESPLVYHPLELEAVLSVQRDFGELVVSETPDGEGISLRVPMPWAGYWYPRRSRDLFEGDGAPLAKVETIAAARGRPASIVAWEKDRFRTFFTDSWEGMCGSWAMAAVSSKEPSKDVVVEGTTFSIADQKALLTKSRENFPNKIYGVRYYGDVDTDGTYQDIRPEAFHTIAMKLLGEHQRSFIIDEDPGIEVWSKPVYRVRLVVKKDEEKPNALVVKASVWLVKERNAQTPALTTIADRTAIEYDYRLYYDPDASADGKYKVIAGEWLAGSKRAHPDMILIPEADGKMASANPQLNAVMDIVEEIVNQE